LIENTGFSEMEEIAKLVVTALTESGIDQLTAINLFYNSNTFMQLSNTNTGFYFKSWQEIYQIFKAEICI
jgi:hypothetical protein